ncbi:helix-turn-helix transcriptional regulator [Nocardia puris]|uniref:Transcriptional regulator with XRE-family HTH domain n=1 Tax=Nocardia puris TaxID=208602 RepID=A0A366DQE8_9NOCA|nr:helix-turn-helix transcriptional regulator [Nocardia puris]MBF6213469.1 helix-turn-helix transcriptional regulator [Nocardia puris]MBF6365601.1 helix-turn-helix transcriptional regulator [Nocardia puris]MBF6460067.1 helix-turn-helix transcriptional regulator [Nocardia puris]RBO91448.1 transcriptional regulator with XRE-family HTH domain [Nocardia puris]
MDDSSIGVRIRRFRGKALTQRQLADQAGVSVDLVRKLEQGGRQTASIASLQKLARALDVDISDLVGKRHGIPSGNPDAGIVAIRRALTPVDDLLGEVPEEEAVSLDDGRRAVDYAWGAYWAGRYELLTTILPANLTQLRATVHAARNGTVAPANELLARMYWVTGCTLVHLGQTDPAFLAIRQALAAAELGDDPLLLATVRGSVAWQLLVQGRYDESRRVALRAAAELEPAGDVAPAHLSAYGSLVLQGATASGRAQDVPEALSLAQAAGEVAVRLGTDRQDYETYFGPSQVIMQTVDVNVSSERYSEALTAAREMPASSGLPQASRARHLTDTAVALTRTGQHQRALDALLTAERVGGPDWLKYQSLPRHIVSELLDHDRRIPLRALARRIGVNT